MASELSIPKKNNKQALVYMLVAVLLFSITPFAFAWGNSSSAPFLFAAMIYFFASLSTTGYVVWLHRTKRKHQNIQETLQTIYSQIRTPTFFYLLVARFEYVLFAFSLLFIDAAIATILYATWPFFMVIITAWLFKKEGRYQKITTEKWLLFIFAFIGVGFVVASQSENFSAITGDLLNQNSLIGIGLVLLAALTGGMGPAYSLKLGSEGSKKSGGGKNDELFFTTAFLIVAWLVNSLLFIILGSLSNESFADISLTTAVLYGFFVEGIGVIVFRIANLKTDNLGINALGYAIPVVSLVWLGVASLINVPHFDWLVIGTVAIITANLLLNFKADKRMAYKALMISLWVGGTVIYLVDGFETSDSLEVAATIFILILAFRVDRFVRRTTDEENSIFSLYRRLEVLKNRGVVDNGVLAELLRIDKFESTQELKDAYSKLKDYLGEAANKILQQQTNKDENAEHPPTSTEANEDALAQIKADIDTIAHSKQQGAHFGELVAIGFVGGIFVIGLLLFSPTETTGSDRFFTDFSSLILAAVTLFLFFNIIDLQKDRRDPVLSKSTDATSIDKNDYSVKFDDTTDRTMQQWVSIVVSLGIIAAYGWLFWVKAVGL